MVMVGGPGHMGPTATQASAAAGLPFAGVPTEMQQGADRLLELEPDHPEPEVDFDHVSERAGQEPARTFGLRDMLIPHSWGVSGALLLLCGETAAMQTVPVLFQQGIDRGISAGDRFALNMVVLVFVGVVAVSILLSRLRQRLNGRIAEQVMFDLRLRLFSHYQRLSLDWYTTSKSGVLLSRMTSDMEYVALLINEGIVNLLIQVLTVGVVTAVLFNYSPFLAVILLGGIIPPLVALTLWFRARSEKGYAEIRDRIADVLADLSENLAGIRVIAATGRRLENAVRHRKVTARFRDANLSMSRVQAIYGPSTEAIGIAAQGLVLAIGGAMVLDGSLTIGELGAFVLYVTTLFAPIQQLAQLYSTYQQGQSGLRKISQVLATQPTVRQRPDAAELPPVTGHIRLENVSFAYDDEAAAGEGNGDGTSGNGGANGTVVGTKMRAGQLGASFDPVAMPALGNGTESAHSSGSGFADGNISDGGIAEGSEPLDDDPPEVLSDVSLEIRPGETFALVGPTGAGKSTIAKLIIRFYDPTDGRITIDGWDLRDLTLSSLRNQLGVVPQEPFLFHGTIRDNVAFGLRDRAGLGRSDSDTQLDADIDAALDLVGLRQLIDSLPKGADTQVHERGVSLSAGERQLLALARAFVAQPRVIVLDEATSSVDLSTEAEIEGALDLLLEGRTAVLIAHRLATAMRADRIAVIDGGGVVELGTHDELVALGGQYAGMYATWMAHAGEGRRDET
ncbi:ABC transporter ATP-binding protein [Candidatus Poriferisodalis multihospitum]|uniref:ABC transporter ATP-binding protein n=1 Tax=Candidatus Poriferisodalis multihospitum TaxID=2983191 RepID=UPI002387FDD2|nr:ABC transporter ATP-binding protein [Candidatus Poriferisodalis multihospitum]MDE0321087.1 ABC transporter ATP-binding protein [Acidimicrobiaceae bacterium]